nr:hypothetical protein [uncultured Rhodoferax sp.]
MTPDDLEALALRMYPSMRPEATEPTAPTPPEPQAQPTEPSTESAPAADSKAAATTDEAPAEAPAYELAPVPPEVLAERVRDHSRRRYSPQGIYGAVLPHSMLDDVQDMPSEVKAMVVEELREMAADVGANLKDVMELRAAMSSVTEPPTNEQRGGWQDEAITRLNAEFGRKATQALADAKKFIRRDPRLVAMLNNNQLGDHPDVVMKFARLAAQARANGKLK